MKNTDYIKLFESTQDKYLAIISEGSNIPFLDVDRNAYLFHNIDDFNQLFGETKFCVKKIESNYEELNDFLWSMGVNCIKVYVRKEEYIYPLKETLQTVGCLDKDLIANLILFNETHAAEFLDSIFKANAIVPVKTTKNKVTYAFAKKNKKNYYLCFSSLKEFEEWKKSSNNDYRPLLISFERYYLQIAKNGGDLLFNPLSIKTIIPRKHIRIK